MFAGNGFIETSHNVEFGFGRAISTNDNVGLGGRMKRAAIRPGHRSPPRPKDDDQNNGNGQNNESNQNNGNGQNNEPNRRKKREAQGNLEPPSPHMEHPHPHLPCHFENSTSADDSTDKTGALLNDRKKRQTDEEQTGPPMKPERPPPRPGSRRPHPRRKPKPNGDDNDTGANEQTNDGNNDEGSGRKKRQVDQQMGGSYPNQQMGGNYPNQNQRDPSRYNDGGRNGDWNGGRQTPRGKRQVDEVDEYEADMNTDIPTDNAQSFFNQIEALCNDVTNKVMTFAKNLKKKFQELTG